MSTISSISEIVRVGGWALRGAGFPFGVAERGAQLLAWTEAVHGGAIRNVFESEEAIKKSQTAGVAARSVNSYGRINIDADGRHLLELGPPVVDLGTAAARLSGFGCVRIDRIRGAMFGTALAHIIAERGLVALIVLGPGLALERNKNAFAPEIVLVCSSDLGASIFTAELTSTIQSCIINELDQSGVENCFLADLESASNKEAEPFFSLICAQLGSKLGSCIQSISGVVTSELPVSGDLMRRFKDAYRLGVPMDMADLKDLYALEVRTWAPTSERSRSQAGYGTFSAVKAST